MPNRPQRPCRKSGCAALVNNGYCDAHTSATRTHDRWRLTASSRGYDQDWVKVRVLALQRDNYLCVHCLAKDIVTPALDVDHIVPITTAPDRRLDLDNLQSLCRSCHVTKTRAEHRALQLTTHRR